MAIFLKNVDGRKKFYIRNEKVQRIYFVFYPWLSDRLRDSKKTIFFRRNVIAVNMLSHSVMLRFFRFHIHRSIKNIFLIILPFY